MLSFALGILRTREMRVEIMLSVRDLGDMKTWFRWALAHLSFVSFQVSKSNILKINSCRKHRSEFK